MSQPLDAKHKAAQTYDAAADHYDHEPLGFWSHFGHRTIERLQLRPGEHVLDVGCGSGASAIPAAERVAPHGRVVGVDLANEMLQLAREKATARGFSHAEFHNGDMEKMDQPDESFDAVVSVFSIFFVADMAAQIRRLWRLVKPGGRLAITTWGPRFCEPLSTIWWDAVRRTRPELHAAFSPWERLTSCDALHRLLAEGGVEHAEVDAENGFQSLRSPDDWRTIVMGSGFRWTVDQLNPADAARVRETCVAWARDNGVTRVETNAILAVARKK